MQKLFKFFQRRPDDPQDASRQHKVVSTLEATERVTLRLKELSAERDSYRPWPQPGQRNRRGRLNA